MEMHICLPKACTNSLLLAQELLTGGAVCVGTCRHVSAEERGAVRALGQSARREIGSNISLTAHFAQ